MPRKQQVWIVAVKQNVDSCQQPEKQNRRSHLSKLANSLQKVTHVSITYLVDGYDGNLFLNQDEICLNVEALRTTNLTTIQRRTRAQEHH